MVERERPWLGFAIVVGLFATSALLWPREPAPATPAPAAARAVAAPAVLSGAHAHLVWAALPTTLGAAGASDALAPPAEVAAAAAPPAAPRMTLVAPATVPAAFTELPAARRPRTLSPAPVPALDHGNGNAGNGETLLVATPIEVVAPLSVTPESPDTAAPAEHGGIGAAADAAADAATDAATATGRAFQTAGKAISRAFRTFGS